MNAEYKKAYFATGGTEEEWAQHNNKVTVTYEVKSQTDETVSFVVVFPPYTVANGAMGTVGFEITK